MIPATLTENLDSEDDFQLAKEETGYQIYRNLWKDFYDWEHDHCVQTLQTLEQAAVYPGDFPSDYSDSELFDSLNEYTDWFSFQGPQGADDTLPLRLRVEEEGFSSYPPYVSCTPSASSVQGPKNFMDKAPFIPFSDDPLFKHRRYASLFNSFGWQTEFWDPDREIIVLEAARRLCGHGFTYSEIDSLQIHYVRLRVHGSAGMLWEVSQRDQLLWPGSQMCQFPNLITQAHPDPDLQEAVTKGVILFCNNLNCLRSKCLTHDPSPPVINGKSTMASKDLKSGTPCNRDCFKAYLGTDTESKSILGTWDNQELSLLLSILGFAPNSHPCMLAVMCKKPCVETYIQQCKHISDNEIEVVKEEASLHEPLDITFSEDELMSSPWIVLQDRVKPCHHPGVCNQYSDCGCYANRQRCKQTCRCSKTCNLKFKGCKCSGNKPCAKENNCPCYNAGRECDPDFCITCDARHSKGNHGLTCQNTALQKEVFPQIWIHPSQFGLGAFAMKPIAAGKYIGEYIGEFISGSIENHTRMIQSFVKRNYNFGLSERVVLDSYLLGNEMRYLNHSKNPNCLAKLMLVNGDIKICIQTVTPIKKHGELFLDYGDGYWNVKADESDDDSD